MAAVRTFGALHMTHRAADPTFSPDTRMRAAFWLSAVNLVLLLVASVAGLLVDGLYRDPVALTSMLRGYDLVALVVVVPVLAITIPAARSGSVRAHLLWLAMLATTAYTYAYYVFLPAFNDLFLVHLAVFSSALFALVFALSAIDVTAVGRSFGPRTPARWISGFLALLAIGLGGMWIFQSLQFAFTDAVPTGSVMVESDALVHLGVALDLAVLVPCYALAAMLLWRRAAFGYLLAAIMLISGVVHQIGYMVALPFQVGAGVPGAAAVDPAEPVIALLFVVAAAVLLLSVRPTAVPNDHDRSVTRPPATA